MVLGKKGITTLVFILNLICFRAEAFSYDFSSSGEKVKWKTTNLQVFLNTQNSSLISSSALQTIFSNSLTEWNGISGISVSAVATSSAPSSARNDVYFSSDNGLFSGAGVLAVTQVAYHETTGQIFEADIIVNDNFTFTTSALSSNYIGDVLTHELGHFLGLGHSEVSTSSMFFELGGGQSTVSSDDQLAIKNLYQLTSSGFVQGKVVAKDSVSVLGAHVEFISRKTGKTIAGVFSNNDGDFSLFGIDEDFLISISPVKNKSSLSSYYKFARTDFCTSSTDYQRSFVQGCNRSREGFPQIIKPSSLTSGNLGKLSVRCNTDVPVNYMLGKGGTFDFNPVVESTLDRNAFVGYFSEDQADSQTPDTFEIDLTDLSVTSGMYLRLNFSSNELYSPVVLSIKVTDGLGSSTTYVYQTSTDGKVTSDRTISILLSSTNSLKNFFTIEVTPMSLEDFVISHPSVRTSQVIPGYGSLDADKKSYLVISDIVNSLGAPLITEVSTRYTDESLCLDGRVPFKSTSLINQSFTEKKKSSNKESDAVACGTVDFDSNGPKNGPFLMLVGFFLIFMLTRRANQHN